MSTDGSPSDFRRASTSNTLETLTHAIPNYRTTNLSVTQAADSSPKNLRVSSKYYASGLLWADYFNNMLKCWEPLVEPLALVIAYEEVLYFDIFRNEFVESPAWHWHHHSTNKRGAY